MYMYIQCISLLFTSFVVVKTQYTHSYIHVHNLMLHDFVTSNTHALTHAVNQSLCLYKLRLDIQIIIILR